MPSGQESDRAYYKGHGARACGATCVSDRVGFNFPLNKIRHFGDESFQTIDCTGTDIQKQENKTPHTPYTQKRNRKTALANKTNYTPVWYAFYDLWPRNGVGPILTARQPTAKCI